MITLNGQTWDLTDWQVLAALGAALLVVFLLLILRAAGRAARAAEPLRNDIGWLAQRVQALGEGRNGCRAALRMFRTRKPRRKRPCCS